MQIISRAGWGARYPDGFGPAPLPAAEVWLHHTAMTPPSADATLEQDCAAVRSVERVGQERFGGGISYSWVVLPSGRVATGHSPNRLGSHTHGHNTAGRAICLHGNYDVHQPTGAQVASVVALLQAGAAAGWWRGARLNGGHRDVADTGTACPGRYAYALIGEINRQAGGGTGRPQIVLDGEDDEMTPADRAMLAEVRDMLRKLKPGTVLPARSPHSRVATDDQYGYTMSAEANAADALAEVRALRAEVAALAARVPG